MHTFKIEPSFVTAALCWLTCFGPIALSAEEPPKPKAPKVASTVESAPAIAPKVAPGGLRRQEARQSAIEGMTRLGEGDVAAAETALSQAVEQWPNHFQFVYGMAQVEAQKGQWGAAIQRIHGLIHHGYSVPVEADPAFDEARERQDYAQAIGDLAKLKDQHVGSSDEVFRLSERDLVPEAVVHDAKTGHYFVSSIRHRKIVRVDSQGKATTFADQDLWAVSGLGVDAKRRRLWAATGALPNMKGYQSDDEHKTALIAYDLDSGKELLRYENAEPGHRLSDLTVDSAGRVYVSDGTLGVWRTSASTAASDPSKVWPRQLAESTPATMATRFGATLELISPPGFFRSPQGIAISSNGRHVYVADYSYGIAILDLETQEWDVLDETPGTATLGIDGLNLASSEGGRDKLVAIQNGSRPRRILRLLVEPETRRIAQAEILAMNLPSWSEPTLGTVVGSEFVYVGNSQWDRFDREGNLPPIETLEVPIILRLPLQGIDPIESEAP